MSGGVYLLNNGKVVLWDRDEPRYAQTSRQMLESGDWVVPRLLDKVRNAKPVLIYWCQAASMAIFGDDAAAARLPSALAIVGTLGALGAVLPRRIGRPRALWAVFILATSAMTIAAGKMAVTDAVLLLWITLSQVALYQLWRGGIEWGPVLLFAVAVALAGLTKGPVVLGVSATTLLSLWLLRRFAGAAPGPMPCRRPQPARSVVLKVTVALALFGVIVAPWLILIERRAPGFILSALSHDVVQRIQSGLEGHKGPPGYYLLTIWGTFFPWSLLLPLAIGLGLHHRRRPVIAFCLAAVLGPWLLMEAVQTKLSHYILPIFPPLAVLTADALYQCIRRRHDDLARPAFFGATVIWGFIVALLGAAPWLALRWFSLGTKSLVSAGIFTAVAIGMATAVIVLFRSRWIGWAAAVMGLGTFGLVTAIYGSYFVHAQYLRTSQRVANELIRLGATVPGEVIMIDYKEPSLAFHQGGEIRPEDDNGYLEHAPPERWPRWIVLTDEIWNATPASIRDRLRVISTFRGWAYADGGRIVQVRVVEPRR